MYTSKEFYQVMKIKHFFETHPVFRYEEFTDFMRSQKVTRPEGWRQKLSYHQKAGHLVHIRRFLYAVKSTTSDTQWLDPYLIASKAAPDSIIAYHTALELHGIAYTTFNEFLLLTSRRITPFSFETQRFKPVMQPIALIKNESTDFATETVMREGVHVKLTTIERTIVDIFSRPDFGGGWEEIFRSLDNVTQFDADKAVKYALLLGKATTISMLGYFFEQRPAHLAVDKKYIDQLLQYIPKKPHYISRAPRSQGKYIKKWQLIIPTEIINRTWEEPNAEDI